MDLPEFTPTIIAAFFLAVLALPLGLAAYRMVAGPGYADRFVALDMLTGVCVAITALTALATGQRAFFDVGLGIALINFVATCAFALFLERKGQDQ